MDMPIPVPRMRFYILVAVLVVAVFGLAAFFSFSAHEARVRLAVQENLSSIAELKSKQLSEWMKERRGDVNVLFVNEGFSAQTKVYLENLQNPKAAQDTKAAVAQSLSKKRLHDWFASIQIHFDYSEAFFLDNLGTIRFQMSESAQPILGSPSEAVSRAAAESLRSGKGEFVDFYKDKDGSAQNIRLAFVAPIFDPSSPSSDAARLPLGCMVVLVDPNKYLYPLIQRWPTPSPTSESMLVRRDGDDVLYLNELRFHKDAALRLRFPLNGENIPSVRAVQGEVGFLENCVDYRGVPVVADVRPVPDTPWFLVNRLDKAEAYAQLRTDGWTAILFSVSAIIVVILTVAGLYFRQRGQTRFLRSSLAAAEAIRKSENQYYNLFNTIGEGFCVIEMVFDAQDKPVDYRILEANLAFQEINDAFESKTGLTTTQDGELGLRSAMLTNDLHLFALLGKIALTGESMRSEIKSTSLNHYFNVSAHRVGKPEQRHVAILLDDVTANKRAEAKVNTLARVIEQCPVSVVITDPNGVIQFVNLFFTQRTGYSVEEVVGKTPRLLKSGKTPPERFVELWTTIKSGKNWSGELFNRTKDGRAYTELAHIAPVMDEKNQIIHFVAVKEDVTASNETALALLNAKQTAEHANAAKGEFLATMSHEIRTPMNGVIGMTGLLLNTDLTEEQRRYAEIVRTCADSLLVLINDILDFSKIEAGKLDLESVDFELDTLLHETATMMAERIHKKGLAFISSVTPGTPCLLRGDSGRLRQMLINLIGNAFKFTSQGEIVVRVSLQSETAESVVLHFSVRDTGLGIPNNKLGSLFQKFSQVDVSTTRKFGGTGLGLAISKQLAELMAGEIGVKSEEGKGSEFWFTVRLAKQAHQIVKETMPAALLGTRLLVVDNNDTHREVLRAQVQAWGMRVDEVADGPTALKLISHAKAAGDPFSIVVVDMRMPHMDGESLGRVLKADAHSKDTHLVMMTAYDEAGQAQRMKEIGFEAYLTKPVRASDLFDCLSTVVAGRSPAQGMSRPSERLAKVLPTSKAWRRTDIDCRRQRCQSDGGGGSS
jgi:PAS domain S-box-containing protein